MVSQIGFYPANQSVHLPFIIQLIGNSAEIRNSHLWWFASYVNRTWVMAPQARIDAYSWIAHLHGCFIPHKAVRPHSEDLRVAIWLEINAGLIVGTLVCKGYKHTYFEFVTLPPALKKLLKQKHQKRLT